MSNSSLIGEVYLLKVGFFSFGSPLSDSAVSKPISDIKATKDNTNISTDILSISGKIFLSLGSLAVIAYPKSSDGGFGELLVIFPSHLRAIQEKIL